MSRTQVWLVAPSTIETVALREGIPPHLEKGSLVFSSGVGAVATLHTLWQAYFHAPQPPKALLSFGIAGSYRRTLLPPTLVYVQRETWGDLGKRYRHKFLPTPSSLRERFPLQLVGAPLPPFLSMPKVAGLTLSSVSGDSYEARFWRKVYPEADIETQENAAYFLFAQTVGIPLLSFRSISNRVGARHWAREEALAALRTFVATHVAGLYEWLLAGNSPS